jgi:hypothetical protein
MEEMLHYEPSGRGDMTGCQKIFNVHCLLWNAEHMLYRLSISFKIDNREIMVGRALFLTGKKTIPERLFERSHSTRADIKEWDRPSGRGRNGADASRPRVKQEQDGT